MVPNWRKLKTFSWTYQCMSKYVFPTESCYVIQRNNVTSTTSAVEPENVQIQSSNYDVTTPDIFSKLAHVMTPLWNVPYEEQLYLKKKWALEVVDMINARLKSQPKTRKLSISPRVYSVERSPITEEYRNKDEFSVRNGLDGNPKTVGFFVGSTASNDVVCVPGTNIISLKQKHKKLAEYFEMYIRTSELPTCFDFAPGGGNWRRFIVRSNEEGHVFAVAICHPQSLSQERLVEEQEKLKEFFTSGPGKDVCPDSLYFQACRHARCTHEQAPYTLLHGEPFLMDKIADKMFRISPDSFFQVNSKGAEVLYEAVLKKAKLTPRTTLLDVCCGIGPISLLAAEHVRGCVGIESVENAVRDAKYNARINNITNVHFFCGLAEKRLRRILEELHLASDIVAVLNPGRAGVDPRVIKLLSDCRQITRLIYVSCKADLPSTLKNFIQLIHEGHFTLQSIAPVDLFPHTWHTELILTFVRW